MDSDRWRQIQRLCAEALERPPDERRAFLDRWCAGDDELRKEVDSYMAHASAVRSFRKVPAAEERDGGTPGRGPVVEGTPAQEARVDGSLEELALNIAGSVLAHDRTEVLVGQTLAHYLLVEKLGEGGMGCVYKARDAHLDRFVALKLLPAERVADRTRKRRFVEEARAASALSHPNIITVYDIDESEGVPFIAMELVEGQTLERHIPRRGMPIRDVLRYGVQIADALAAAHHAGIIHRDLKPSNVMITSRGRVKVLDFGLAKLTDAQSSSESASTRILPDSTGKLTDTGEIVGTVSYMSPEQADARPVDARSDVFAMGCLLYEMITGQRAFQGETKLRTLSAVVNAEPPPVSQVNGEVPVELERVVNRCLRKDPERRFQTMADLRVALEELAEESDSGKLKSGSRRPTARPRHSFLLAAGIAAGVLVAMGSAALGLWFAWHGSGPENTTLAPPVQVTSYPTIEEYPTMSPDGRQVAYSGNVEDVNNYDIYVKMISAEPSLRLTRDPQPDTEPAWSPDGRWIAFLRGVGGVRRLMLVSPLGGPETMVADDVVSDAITWAPSSSEVVVALQRDASHPAGVPFAVSISSGERRQLGWPSAAPGGVISPDGHKLAYVSRDVRPFRLYVAALSAHLQLNAPTWIDNVAFTGGGRCAWTADSRDLVCSFRAEGDPDFYLWRIRTDRRAPPERLPFSQGAMEPGIPASGGTLVFDRWSVDTDIWRSGNPNTGRASARKEFNSSTRNDVFPQYSPDGKRVAFLSQRSGQYQLWETDAEGGGVRKLSSVDDMVTAAPGWSPDSSSIVYTRRSGLYVVAATGGPSKRIATDPVKKPSWAAYASDGQTVYFESDDASRPEIWRVPVAGGHAMQVTRNGGARPLALPDGRTLVYMRENQQKYCVFSADIGDEPERLLFESSLGPPDYTLAGAHLYFIRYSQEDSATTIEEFDIAAGAAKPFVTLDATQRWSAPGLSVSPDGAWVLYALFKGTGDLMRFENFR